jgi:alpha-1,6-mannosyltransferase
MIGLGLCLGAVVVLGATVQPWYLLWAAIPLAAGTGTSKFRTAATVVSAVVAMLVPPNGSTFDGRTFLLPYAYIAAAIVLTGALFALRGKLPIRPWRDPDGDTPVVPATGPGAG